MTELYGEIEPRIEDGEFASKVGNSLELAHLLVETNNLYVRTCFAYFEYRENPGEESRQRLLETVAVLKRTRSDFMRAPEFCYDLFGIDQLIRNVDESLDDLPQAEAKLASAHDEEGVKRAIITQQEEHARALGALSGDAVKFLHWRGRVDGRDILHICGETVRIEHIYADPINSAEHQFLCALPGREVTVIVKNIESRPIHPFILEQPTEENDYTAKIYLVDQPRGGYGWWEIELYYVDKSPDELGLAIPW
jgi:hypothetical protein